MIFGIDPTFTAKEVKDIIKSTATGSYGEDEYKMLNAKLAVEKAIELRNQKAKENSVAEPTDGHKYEIFHDTLTWEKANDYLAGRAENDRKPEYTEQQTLDWRL